MSTSICSRCLARLSLAHTPARHASQAPLTQVSSFSTSSAQASSVQLKKKVGGYQQKIRYRVTGAAHYKKNKRQVPKLPPPGERRAQRKRIVLSNTNAFEVKDMTDLSPANMTDARALGEVLGLEGGLLDQLRDAKVFKKTQSWSLFRRPATLIRQETLGVADIISGMTRSPSDKVVRQVFAGGRISGKSILLLQAMSMAYLNRWVVINIPEAQDFVINHYSYTPLQADSSDQEQLYVQPHLTAELLTRLAFTNESVLKTLTPNHKMPASIPGTTPKTLHDLAMLGANTPAQAWPVWQHLFQELTTAGGNPRPPILFAADSIDHFMGPTKYFSSTHEVIHAHQFTLIRQFLNLLFKPTPLSSGGLVIGATTASNNPTYPSFQLLLQQISALNQNIEPTSDDFPLPGPYQTVDSKVTSLLDPTANTTVTRLNGLSRHETRGLLQYFIKSGILKASISDLLVGEKWTESGGGVIGELSKVATRARVDPEKRVETFGTNQGVRGKGAEHRPRG